MYVYIIERKRAPAMRFFSATKWLRTPSISAKRDFVRCVAKVNRIRALLIKKHLHFNYFKREKEKNRIKEEHVNTLNIESLIVFSMNDFQFNGGLKLFCCAAGAFCSHVFASLSMHVDFD